MNQILDGVTYLTLPEPADPTSTLYNSDAYKTGDRLPNSGRVRFTVGPQQVKVDYLREWLPADRPPGTTPETPAYSFTLPVSGGSKAQSKALLPLAGTLDGQTLVGPPDTAVTLSSWFDQPSDYFYTWGSQGESLARRTETKSAPGQSAVTATLANLEPNQGWAYQLHWKPQGQDTFRDGPAGRFVTPRAAGQSFQFVIEADPHLDENSNSAGQCKKEK